MRSVSVIIPCFRDSRTLGRAIDSVIAQTHPVDEIVVVNDCSPETEEIERVCSNYPGIVYVRNAVNLGLAASRNVGISVAVSDIISFLDADDELHPQKVEFQLSMLRENSAVACGVRVIHAEQRAKNKALYSALGEVKYVTDSRRLLFNNYLTGASLMAPKVLLQRVGGFDESLRSCEDFDLWFRLIEYGVPITRFKMPLYYYYFNSAGLSKNYRNISQWEIEVLKRKFSRDAGGEISKALQLTVWTVWLCKHFARSEISSDEVLRNKTIENTQLLIPFNFFSILLSLIGKMRILFPYGRLWRIASVACVRFRGVR